MRYSNHGNKYGDEVKVAVLAEQMRATNNSGRLSTDLLWVYVAVASALSIFLMLH